MSKNSLQEGILKDNTSQNMVEVSENGCKTSDHDDGPAQSLANLQEILKTEIPEHPSAQYISDAAHELIDKLNTKRKVDTLLVEQFRQAMESQTAKMIDKMEQHMYSSYEILNKQVDEKLQELFSFVNTITTTEGELENFRESLRMLYQEMQDC